MSNSRTLEGSYAACCQLARRTGRNFYYSFLVLPKPLYRSMCALYAYMRICDDLADDEAESHDIRQRNLDCWRSRIELLSQQSRDAGIVSPPAELAMAESIERLLPAIHHMVHQHGVPWEYLFDVITGVEMDLQPQQLATMAELERYCYHVAGVVGLCCIHLWGFRDPAAKASAIDCGFAFQLTNILRDLKEDAQLGRCYLPREILDQFRYSFEDLKGEIRDERFRNLMEMLTAQARERYQLAEKLFPLIEPVGRPILRAMISIYNGLLNEIERRQFDVFRERVRLPAWKKAWWTAVAWWKER